MEPQAEATDLRAGGKFVAFRRKLCLAARQSLMPPPARLYGAFIT